MCGIIGFVNQQKAPKGAAYHTSGGIWQQAKFIKQGLIVDMLRGVDGAGVFYSDRQDGSTWIKIGATGYDLVTDKLFTDRAEDIERAWFAAAHNRAATIGQTTTDNAHPFTEGPVTLVHNGTLRGDLPISMETLDVDVDSHAICHNLAAVPASRAAPDVLEHLRGAFALAWYDGRDDSFNLARNHERPMYLYKSRAGDYMFASEEEMLELLCARMSLSYKPVGELKVGEQLKFKRCGGEPTVIKFTPYSQVPVKKYKQSTYTYDAATDDDPMWTTMGSVYGYASYAVPPTVTVEELPAPAGGVNQLTTVDEVDDSVLYYGPQGSFVTVAAFKELTKRGCSWCTAEIEPKSHKHVHWHGVNAPVCAKCNAGYLNALKRAGDEARKNGKKH